VSRLGNIRIATSSYHVGHATAPTIALEKGFFRQEGLDHFELLLEGLIPPSVERQALFAAMKQRGVEIVLGAKAASVFALNSQGADLYIVACWRFASRTQWYAQPGIKSFADLKGKKIGIREAGGISYAVMSGELRKAGVDPQRDVEWVLDPMFAYHDTADHADALRAGQVDCAASGPPFSLELEKAEYTVLLSTKHLYPEGRPERVIAARGVMTEERKDELKKFFRAILRAFWFERDPDHFSYLSEMERKLREASPSEDERALRKANAPDRFEGRSLPVDGRAPLSGLKIIADEMKATGDLRADFSVKEALRDEIVTEAFQELRSRKALEGEWRKVCEIVEKWGY
jgi:ABC-type nitrate/sulfonate/bicarbonate transport system substrate-binding protein